MEAGVQLKHTPTNQGLKSALTYVLTAKEGGTRMMDKLITVEVTYVKDDGVNKPDILKSIRAMTQTILDRKRNFF